MGATAGPQGPRLAAPAGTFPGNAQWRTQCYAKLRGTWRACCTELAWGCASRPMVAGCLQGPWDVVAMAALTAMEKLRAAQERRPGAAAAGEQAGAVLQQAYTKAVATLWGGPEVIRRAVGPDARLAGGWCWPPDLVGGGRAGGLLGVVGGGTGAGGCGGRGSRRRGRASCHGAGGCAAHGGSCAGLRGQAARSGHRLEAGEERKKGAGIMSREGFGAAGRGSCFRLGP